MCRFSDRFTRKIFDKLRPAVRDGEQLRKMMDFCDINSPVFFCYIVRNELARQVEFPGMVQSVRRKAERFKLVVSKVTVPGRRRSVETCWSGISYALYGAGWRWLHALCVVSCTRVVSSPTNVLIWSARTGTRGGRGYHSAGRDGSHWHIPRSSWTRCSLCCHGFWWSAGGRGYGDYGWRGGLLRRRNNWSSPTIPSCFLVTRCMYGWS